MLSADCTQSTRGILVDSRGLMPTGMNGPIVTKQRTGEWLTEEGAWKGFKLEGSWSLVEQFEACEGNATYPPLESDKTEFDLYAITS